MRKLFLSRRRRPITAAAGWPITDSRYCDVADPRRRKLLPVVVRAYGSGIARVERSNLSEILWLIHTPLIHLSYGRVAAIPLNLSTPIIWRYRLSLISHQISSETCHSGLASTHQPFTWITNYASRHSSYYAYCCTFVQSYIYQYFRFVLAIAIDYSKYLHSFVLFILFYQALFYVINWAIFSV